MSLLSRRGFVFGSVAAALAAPAAAAVAGQTNSLPRVIGPSGNLNPVRKVPVSLYEMDLDASGGALDPVLLPPAEAETDYPIIPSSRPIPARFQAQDVEFYGLVPAGTIVVDPGEHYLYHFNTDGTARRYGVGVGRAGFAWTGEAVIGLKRRWPRWVPPREMVARDEKARRWANGQPGGPGNPLGARALYLYRDGQDTLFRIHGTNQPGSIGKSVSSGCIRMLNEHIAELYDRVTVGTRVVVLSAADTAVSEAGG